MIGARPGADPLDDLLDALTALVHADADGTTTEGHIAHVWRTVAPIVSRLPDQAGYLLMDMLEARLPERARSALKREVSDRIERHIGEALQAGMPMLAHGGIVASAQACDAIERARYIR